MTNCSSLSPRYRVVARLLWAREHKRLHAGHWQHVFFVDECRFILDRKDGKQRVRRVAGENLRDHCIHATAQGRRPLWRENATGGAERVTAAAYGDILSYARRVYGRNFRMQDESARPQWAAARREFLGQLVLRYEPHRACMGCRRPSDQRPRGHFSKFARIGRRYKGGKCYIGWRHQPISGQHTATSSCVSSCQGWAYPVLVIG